MNRRWNRLQAGLRMLAAAANADAAERVPEKETVVTAPLA